MQLICDGVQSKQDVLAFTIDQYKEVFIKARREFGTVVNVSAAVDPLTGRKSKTTCMALEKHKKLYETQLGEVEGDV